MNTFSFRSNAFCARMRGAIMASIAVTSCASVPPEAVELSYIVGQDLVSLQNSYDLLIEERFADYRAQRVAYLEDVWTPAFVAEWIEDGRLIDTARGVVVYDESQNQFLPPTPGREQQQLLATIYSWSDAAIAEIADKRASLLDPLDRDERQVRREARAAFDRLIQANAVITAHLNSVREVQDLQLRAQDALGIRDVVETLNNRLISISDRAVQGLEEIRKADGLVDKGIEIRSRFEEDN